MDVKRVLIPTDLSEKSNAALHSADLFIEKFDCMVDLMHVIPLSKYLGDSFDKLGVPLDMDNDVYPKIVENQRKELSSFANEHIKKKENRGEYLISIDRKPSDSIIKQIEKGNYDLVMMSAKGEHHAEFFHGSITDKIIRRSKTPVLTLSDKINSGNINKIVVPCDYSEYSMAAIPLAFDMAQQFNAKIELLNIVEMYSYDVQNVEPATISINEGEVYGGLKSRLKSFFEDHEEFKFTIEDGKNNFEDVLVRHEETGEVRIDYKSVIIKSVIAHHEIVDYANEHADLVVMSTHGRTGLSRMLLGSTTEQVIQHLEKPQITIKPDLEES